MTDEKTFSPFKPGEILPAKGFLWRVMEANKSEVRLQVCGISKTGRKMGYKVTYKKDSELDLKEEDQVEIHI